MHAIFDAKDMFGMAYYHTTHIVFAVCSMHIVNCMLIFCITLTQLHCQYAQYTTTITILHKINMVSHNAMLLTWYSISSVMNNTKSTAVFNI